MKNSTLCYIKDSNKYLMLHRTKKKNDENHDKWIGIGGKFELGESPFDCIKREIFEETGLTVSEPSYRGIITFFCGESMTEYMHLFTTDRFEGKLRDCDEGELEWISRDALYSLPMWEGDKIFLDLLEQPVPFFSLKLVYSADGVLLDHELRFTRQKQNALISACLLGLPCRYDGLSKPLDEEKIAELSAKFNLIPICPEQLGGLPTPRPPCEIRGDRVVREDGSDATREYTLGAQSALELARRFDAKIAFLKAKSPSCGSGKIYDGSFTRTLTDGDGVTAKLLKGSGIDVVSL